MRKKKTRSAPGRSQMRKHYYLEQYVVIAPKRKTRPFTVSKTAEEAEKARAGHLPIENDPSIFEIRDDKGKWQVKVVENGFPALTLDNPEAYGKQEVVLETPHRQLDFCDLSVEQITNILKAYQNRIEAIMQIDKIKHVSVFKNHGFQAGSSLAHTHSQIIATAIVPPQVENESKIYENLKKKFGSSPLGAALEWEREQQVRIVASSLYATAVCPYASRFPLEVWLIPHRQVTSIRELSNNELASFAKMLKGLTGALNNANIAYNYYLHESPIDHENHFVIKVTPRVNIQAGFGLDTAISINPEAPETAARWYRKYLRSHNLNR